MTLLVICSLFLGISALSYKYFQGKMPKLMAFLHALEFLQAYGREGSDVTFKHLKSGKSIKAELHTVGGVRLICLDVTSLDLNSLQLNQLIALAESKHAKIFTPKHSNKKIAVGLTSNEAFANTVELAEQLFDWKLTTRFIQEIDLRKFDVKQYDNGNDVQEQ
jgi:hypothetical protein